MELEFYRSLEQTLDDMRNRIKMLEDAITQIPQINFEADPSRPAGVVVEPSAIVEEPV